MATVTISDNSSASTGALATDTIFYIETGSVALSTDGGVTFIPFGVGEKVVFAQGRDVTYRRASRNKNVIFKHMPI